MSTPLLSKTALATLAAGALFLPFGAPLPGSCLRAIGVARAAPTPSPSCGGDLRECLRASADLRQTTFGGRYVTAEDVARCVEAFRACISGGAGGADNASPRNSATRENGKAQGLPERFGITINNSPPQIASDCAATGDAVQCTVALEPLPEGTDSMTGKFTGNLSDLTLTGTYTERTESSDRTGCRGSTESTSTVTYTFTPDGAVTLSWQPYEMQGTVQCPSGVSDTNSTLIPAGSATGTWSPIE